MRIQTQSSSCLFHYTKSFETLLSILKSGFRFSVVREAYPQIGWGNSPLTALGIHRTFVDNRIVCFCDIPLTLAAGHRTFYHSYAIGLSKKWAMRNKMTPVRYVHSDSPGFSGKLIEFQKIENNRRDSGEAFLPALIHHKTGEIPNIEGLPDEEKKLLKVFEQLIEEALQFITDGAPFFKMYEGDDPLQGSPLKRYYDEQEWRVASDDPNRDYLRFSWDDVRYIICATRSECEELYKHCESISSKLGLKDSYRLWQKLLSFEEIDEDF